MSDNTDEKSSEKTPHKGIYVLPNLFTTASLFFGFYAIIQSITSNFEAACLALFIAMVLDSLDGRVARMTNTTSDFGKEYDSLADVISFGLAPSIAIYFFAMHDFGKLGWVVSFLYVASTALRLARFNSAVETTADKKYFQGLPCPAAAGVLASFIWISTNYGFYDFVNTYVTIVLAVSTSLAMVSNVPYHSFKDINLKGRMSFVGLFMIVMLFVFVASDPPTILFIIFFSYLVSGPLLCIPYFKRKLAGVPSVSQALDIDNED